ncbi:PepSY1/2 domain-containing protein [Sporosarcina pasteurii]|uniref:PSPA12 n=1 Tax=Sporosarcina pasteurii TaxID=1474 RepID=A0A380BJL1_SPOPA|nr:PepSY1/2 domain-containing protein [Sporosarcina pasteurii]MDS9470805.1 germination protein YpeB [Sporosarcina pasteurii]QBQ05526.1 spore gernimation protein [Sporosarcina pasteurii]SUJ02370.1 PSPA12 [Sporosarcina pasteurii]
MKKIIFVLVYAIAALAIFAYGKSTENQQLSYLLSGQYAKKMTEASQKLEELDTAVKKTLLFNESDGFDDAREDIWRLSSDVKNAVGSLPLDRGFSNSWMNYLGRLGNYAKETERLNDKEEYHQVMTQASVNLREMADEWQLATADLIRGDVSVESWSNQLDSVDSEHDWDGMRETVKQYTESDFPLTASESDSLKKKELQTLTDKKVTREEAIERFKFLFPEVSNSSIVVENSKPGAPYPFYHIRFAEDSSVGYIDITEKGGHVLSFLSERPFGQETQSYEFIKEKAEQFLSSSGYGDTVLEEARENHTSWHFVFVRVEPEYEAKVFSDVIHLKVAKDTGGIIGLNAMEYIQKENLKPQKIVEQNWEEFFRTNVTVVEEELAYVENDRLDQRLSYYLTVTMEVDEQIDTYVVVVDTETAEVIKTEKQP